MDATGTCTVGEAKMISKPRVPTEHATPLKRLRFIIHPSSSSITVHRLTSPSSSSSSSFFLSTFSTSISFTHQASFKNCKSSIYITTKDIQRHFLPPWGQSYPESDCKLLQPILSPSPHYLPRPTLVPTGDRQRLICSKIVIEACLGWLNRYKNMTEFMANAWKYEVVLERFCSFSASEPQNGQPLLPHHLRWIKPCK